MKVVGINGSVRKDGNTALMIRMVFEELEKEIEKQIIHYLNLIAYQNRIFEKVRRLKYLRDQFLLEEKTDIRQVAE